MEEEKTKICENCKNEIPLANFIIHAPYCARNIRLCVVCKEAVPAHKMQQHHDDQHKLDTPVRCKQCGEDVSRTDLEDHIRDSCALTMVSCRFCTLKLRRREVPIHERLCYPSSARLCECGEWIMMKYWQLHHETNHVFIRLDDDPVPVQSTKMSPAGKKIASMGSIEILKGIKDLNISVHPRKGISKEANVTAGPSGTRSSQNSYPIASTSQGVPKLKEDYNMSNLNGAIAREKKSPIQSLANNGTDKVRTGSTSKKCLAPLPPSTPRPVLQQEQNKYKGYQKYAANEDLRNGSNIGSHGLQSTENNFRIRRLPDVCSAGRNVGELTNLKPMTPQEFNNRYMDIRDDRRDRFSEIKTSLTELRRGLNEVTSPYNSNTSTDTNYNSRHDQEALCEICGTLLLLKDLLLHQTACSPDVSRCRSTSRSSQPRSPEPTTPLIPCEFCNMLLPVYLVCNHQERCRRERNTLPH